MGTLAPMVAGAITSDNHSWGAWRTVFWVAGVLYTLGCLPYLLFIEVRGEGRHVAVLLRPSLRAGTILILRTRQRKTRKMKKKTKLFRVEVRNSYFLDKSYFQLKIE